jgi:two-component system sensor kinase FixL
MNLPALANLQFPVFISNAGGRLTFVNESWQNQFGIEVGAPWQDAFPQLDFASLATQWQACHESLQPFAFDAYANDVVYRIDCQPAEIDADSAMQVFGTLSDITSESLAQAQAEAILDTTVDAIIIIDEEGRIESFNQAATGLFGYQPEEVMGKDVNVLMPDPYRTQHAQYMRNYLTTGTAKIIGIGRELEAVNRDGLRIPIYLAVSEVKANGKRRFTGIIRDLSEQHAAREVLAEQREKLAHVGRLSTMGEMTASIAHEINQPLTAISMYAQAGVRLIERGEPNLGQLREALEKLTTQSLRAGAIIERIQRFARAQETQREMVDVNALLEDLEKLAESDAHLHDIQLEFNLKPDLPEAFCDPIQIQQVALNLIRNAIDAMMEVNRSHGHRIEISTELIEPALIRIAVADLGAGVADSQLKLLFTPFHTTKKDGMGMGLSICRSIMSEHGGTLSFQNNEGPGATFFFTLPAGMPDE